jgi:predicted ester cyclase
MSLERALDLALVVTEAPSTKSGRQPDSSVESRPVLSAVEWEFIVILRVRDGKLVEHWTHMDFEALRMQMRPRE